MKSLNPAVKAFLIAAFKNAINAILTNAALMAMLPTIFNMHSTNGMWNILKLGGTAVMSREWLVWGPKVLAWTTSTGDSK